MVQNFTFQNAAEINNAAERRIEDTDLEEPTLSSTDRYFPIFRVTGTNTKDYAPGVGSRNESFASGWADLDLQNSGGSPINGKGRWAMYTDDELEEPAYYSTSYQLNNLRSAVAADRKDKALLPGLAPFAPQDWVLVFEVQPKDSSEGDTVDSANSDTDLGIPYSMVR